MKIIYASIVLAVLALPGAALAGWGAIAYNSVTGAMSEAHGYSGQTLPKALPSNSAALAARL
jgi:hypothetical protein